MNGNPFGFKWRLRCFIDNSAALLCIKFSAAGKPNLRHTQKKGLYVFCELEYKDYSHYRQQWWSSKQHLKVFQYQCFYLHFVTSFTVATSLKADSIEDHRYE